MSARLSDIESTNLGEIREEVATLRAEIHTLTESSIVAIPQVIPLLIQLAPPYGYRYFDIFMKNKNLILVVRTKRGREEVLQYPYMLFDQALK